MRRAVRQARVERERRLIAEFQELGERAVVVYVLPTCKHQIGFFWLLQASAQYQPVCIEQHNLPPNLFLHANLIRQHQMAKNWRVRFSFIHSLLPSTPPSGLLGAVRTLRTSVELIVSPLQDLRVEKGYFR